ncbi:MAG: hypothetical protein Q9217_003841 [Psora testacea]
MSLFNELLPNLRNFAHSLQTSKLLLKMTRSKAHCLFAILLVQFLLSFATALESQTWRRRLVPAANTTRPTSEASTPSTNLTFTPWPPTPYRIIFRPEGYSMLIIFTDPVASYPPIDLDELKDFLKQFAQNLQREYPVPSSIPTRAGQSSIDPHSYTRWTLELEKGFLPAQVPTKVALRVLATLQRLLTSHGPASVNAFIQRGEGGRWLYDATIALTIENIAANLLSVSSLNQFSGFKTS